MASRGSDSGLKESFVIPSQLPKVTVSRETNIHLLLCSSKFLFTESQKWAVFSDFPSKPNPGAPRVGGSFPFSSVSFKQKPHSKIRPV